MGEATSPCPLCRAPGAFFPEYPDFAKCGPCKLIFTRGDAPGCPVVAARPRELAGERVLLTASAIRVLMLVVLERASLRLRRPASIPPGDGAYRRGFYDACDLVHVDPDELWACCSAVRLRREASDG